MSALRVVLAVIGGLCYLGVMASMLRALVVPGIGSTMLAGGIGRAVGVVFGGLCRLATHHRQRRNQILLLEAPALLSALLVSWLLGFLGSLALLLLPVSPSFGAAVRQAGSSLFTLGFVSPKGGYATAIDFVGAATGLVVVALLIAYLPTLYGAYNRRVVEVGLVAVRAGMPPWGPDLLARTRVGVLITRTDLPSFYSQWERWVVDVAESHSSYPVLLRFRSADADSSWLVALLAVLDSAALYHAAAPEEAPVEARFCLRTGIGALRQLAASQKIPFDPDPRPDALIALDRAEFEQGIDRLRLVGFPMTREGDELWRHFSGWRVNYESIIYRLAYDLSVVPALWSGPRRWPDAPIGPHPYVNRTPEAPEGAALRYRVSSATSSEDATATAAPQLPDLDDAMKSAAKRSPTW